MSTQSFRLTPHLLLIAILVITNSCTQTNKPTSTEPTDSNIAVKDGSANFKNPIDSNVAVRNDSANFKFVKESPYDLDTTLKGGYHLAFRYDLEAQYLIYKKGNKVIDTISSTSLGLSYLNLGYISADFDKTFVFAQKFGGGNPLPVQLYDKKTARNLIKAYSAWIDVDRKKQILLFSENDVPSPGDSLSLYDEHKAGIKKYPFPKEVFGEPEILRRIKLKHISDKTFTIRYEYDDWKKGNERTYRR